jgi:tRNA-specific 2-thiouridylase
VHDKPDSTGICFIGERPFGEFLARYLPVSPGPIETLDGRPLGEHRGLPFYTLGQRAGLTLGGMRDYAPEPWYVAGKDARRNVLLVVQRHEQRRLESGSVRIGPINWLCRARAGSFPARVRLRHRQPAQPALVRVSAGNGAWLAFDSPQRAATPGQYAVLYEDGRCLGGAVIEEAVQLPQGMDEQIGSVLQEDACRPPLHSQVGITSTSSSDPRPLA